MSKKRNWHRKKKFGPRLGHGGGGGSGGAPVATLVEEPRIDYGAQWTAYFDAIVAGEAAGEPPHRLVAQLDQAPADDAVAVMFRAWIHGAWATRADWGAPPAGLDPFA